MKKIPILYILLLGAFLFSICRYWTVLQNERASKGLSLSNESMHWDDAPGNSKIKSEVVLSNKSSKAIEIKSIKSSCSCTTSEDLSGERLEAGSSRRLPFEMNTGSSGRDSADLEIAWAYEGNDRLFFSHLDLTANTVNYVSTEESVVDFGEIQDVSHFKGKIKLRKKKGVLVTGIRSKNSLIVGRLLAGNGKEEEEIVVAVHMLPDAKLPFGLFRDELVIEYETPQISDQFSVLVKGLFMEPGMGLLPQTIYLGAMGEGEVIEKNLTFTLGPYKDYKFVRYGSTKSENWKTEVLQDKGRANIKCSFQAVFTGGSRNVSDSLQFYFRNSVGKEMMLNVPYYGAIKKRSVASAALN